MHKYVTAFLSLHDIKIVMKHYMADTMEEAIIQCLSDNDFNMNEVLKNFPELNEAEAFKEFAFNSDCSVEAYRVS